jgi:hypothetical protein
VISKRKAKSQRGKKVTFAQVMPLFQQWVPDEGKGK